MLEIAFPAVMIHDLQLLEAMMTPSQVHHQDRDMDDAQDADEDRQSEDQSLPLVRCIRSFAMGRRCDRLTSAVDAVHVNNLSSVVVGSENRSQGSLSQVWVSHFVSGFVRCVLMLQLSATKQ